MADNCIWNDEAESYPVYEEKLRKARKTWTCCECGDEIQPGQLYEHFRGLFDGFWDSYQTCARCALVATDFFRGRIVTCMVEHFLEAHGFDYRDGIPADFAPCGEEDRR